MRFWRQSGVRFSTVIILVLLGVLGASFGTIASGEVVLYHDNFEDGVADGWDLTPGWQVHREANGNYVLSGEGLYRWAKLDSGHDWTDYFLKCRLKLINGGIHLNFLMRDQPREFTRYAIAFRENSLHLMKEYPPGNYRSLGGKQINFRLNVWHDIEIVGKQGHLQVYVDGRLRLEYDDPNPLLQGRIAFETIEEPPGTRGESSHAHIDDVEVTALGRKVSGLQWVRTGGPLGGLGYDVRMRPDDPDVMYVTDAWAGIFMSEDGGETWFPSNKGIITRAGMSGDSIPVFCLTVDPHDSDIVWVGTQNERGIFKSTDGERTWVKKDNGVVERNGITFRGFTVDPRSSDIVYAAGEISSWMWAGEQRIGREFDMTKGVVYKTTDGGRRWRAIWRGDNLARYVWIDPRNPDVLYVSTGIFDREAANSDPDTGRPGGVGIIKSTDGGQTWREINVGLESKYIGTLFMDPGDPDILLAGAGNEAWPEGNGVYLSVDGGATWEKRLGGENITSVEYSVSNSNIAYAGSFFGIYRSEDGGRTWHRMCWGKNGWGSPGVQAGFPIDFQVDPRDPNRIFVNNYGGGNFLSTDGGRTWSAASAGYTGAQVRDIAVDPTDADRVFAAARSGIFVSTDGGEHWVGINYAPLPDIEWNVVVIDPNDPQHLLGANNGEYVILETHNAGQAWRHVIQAPGIDPRFPVGAGMGWRAIAFTPTNPKTVYAGTSAFVTEALWESEMLAKGIFVSHDGGTTWDSTNDALSRDANVSALAVSPVNPNVVYAATGTHGLLKTTDGGRSWTAINRGLPSHPVALSIACHPTDPRVIFAGLIQAGLYRSTDGGTSWQPSSAGMNPEAVVSDIVFDPMDPNVMFTTDRMSGVYRSTNGGTTWHAVNQGLRNRDVTTLAISSDGKTLYAGTEGEGVFRLDLTGQESDPGSSPTQAGDRDGDGVPDEEDYCPDYPGSKETNGC